MIFLTLQNAHLTFFPLSSRVFFPNCVLNCECHQNEHHSTSAASVSPGDVLSELINFGSDSFTTSSPKCNLIVDILGNFILFCLLHLSITCYVAYSWVYLTTAWLLQCHSTLSVHLSIKIGELSLCISWFCSHVSWISI